MARALLYNITEEKRRKKVKTLLFRLGIPGREVPPAEQGRRIRELLDGTEADPEAGAPEPEELFSEEMIVLHGLSPRQFHALLDGMKAQGVRIPLKAVTTENNLEWTSLRLRGELIAEAEAMASGKGVPAHGGT